MQDGGFTSATELDTDADPQSYGFGSVSWGTLWTVLPQDLDAVNAAAESSGGTLYSQASRLVRICTLNLPDGSCVAFPGMTCELDEPVQVAAYWDELRGGWQAWRDAVGPGTLPDGPQLSFETPRWQGHYCFVWPQSTDRMTAGVYRVDQALSAAEADAQDVSQAPRRRGKLWGRQLPVCTARSRPRAGLPALGRADGGVVPGPRKHAAVGHCGRRRRFDRELPPG